MNLSACLDKKAVMQELIKKNPCDNITLPKIEKHEVNVYTQDEITQISRFKTLQCYSTTVTRSISKGDTATSRTF